MIEPSSGACRICEEGNGWENDSMAFDAGFVSFYHPKCLREAGVTTIREYVSRK